MVTFFPALWLLVPGLARSASARRNSRATTLWPGVENFSTTLFTIVAIALGSLVGSGVYNAFFDPIFRARRFDGGVGAAAILALKPGKIFARPTTAINSILLEL